MTGGATVFAIHLQTKRRVTGTLVRINIGGIQNGSLLFRAELNRGHEHETAPRRAERDKCRDENAKAGLHDFTSHVSSGALTAATAALINAHCHLKNMASRFAAKSKLPSNSSSQPIVLTRKN